MAYINTKSVRDSAREAIHEAHKSAKHEVDYSKASASQGSDHCGNCEHFERSAHACSKVKGTIHADMWCKLYHKLPTKLPTTEAEHASRRRPMEGRSSIKG